MTVDIIGIDCATAPADTGVAYATLSLPHGRPKLQYLSTGSAQKPPAHIASELLTPTRPALIGLDAPLGWPQAMGRLLRGHRAGEALDIKANDLFRRYTDVMVRRYLGKQTLDVGADRIARTAVAALELLEELRRLTTRALPVATRSVPDFGGQPAGAGASGETDAVLEVYPRGRLIAQHGLAYGKGYRASTAERERRALLEDIAGEMDFLVDVEPAVRDVDLLDAMLCVLSGVDVLHGRCTPPDAVGAPLEKVDQEGWIWLPL